MFLSVCPLLIFNAYIYTCVFIYRMCTCVRKYTHIYMISQVYSDT
nr:MAG TPA: hypothetical protein [Caudoviricetes sp.]